MTGVNNLEIFNVSSYSV